MSTQVYQDRSHPQTRRSITNERISSTMHAPSLSEDIKKPSRNDVDQLYNLYLDMHEYQKKIIFHKKTTQFLMMVCGDFALHWTNILDTDTNTTNTNRTKSKRRKSTLVLEDELAWYQQVLQTFIQWSTLDNIAGLLAWREMQSRIDIIFCSQPRNIRALCEKDQRKKYQLRDGHETLYMAYNAGNIHSSLEEVTGNCLPYVLSFDQDLRKVLKLHGHEAQNFADLLDWVMDKTESQSKLYRLCERALRRMCGKAAILPSSYLLEEKDLIKTSANPNCGGGFADVFEGLYRGGKVALKVLRYFGAVDVKKLEKSFYRETIIWRRLSHPNIVPFLGIADKKISPLCMVSSWMENGNLAVYIKRHPNANRLDLVVDIAKGLSYLHQLGIIHGDVKSGNVLIDADHRARLSDFGLASVTHESRTACAATTTTATIGSIRWMAPEILHPSASDKGQSTAESDIYALAMTMYEAFTGQLPFFDCSRDATVVINVTIGIRPERPGPPATDLGLSDRVWSAMEKCWLADRTQRPRLPTILECLEDERLHYVIPIPKQLYPSTNKGHPLRSSQEIGGESDWESDEYEDEDARYRDILHFELNNEEDHLHPLRVPVMHQEILNSHIEVENTLVTNRNV